MKNIPRYEPEYVVSSLTMMDGVYDTKYYRIVQSEPTPVFCPYCHQKTVDYICDHCGAPQGEDKL